MQKTITRLAVMTAGLLAGCTLVGATTVQYTFSGTCTYHCTGTVSAVLTLEGYTPGDTLTAGEFVSLSYLSNDNSVTITAPLNTTPGASVLQALPVTSGNVSEGFISPYPGYGFATDTGGGWNLEYAYSSKNAGPVEFGNSGLWTLSTTSSATPEPGALLLASTGGALLVLMRKLKRRQA